MDYVISKSTGEKVTGKSKFLDLLVRSGKYFREGEAVKVTPKEAEAFIEAKLKALADKEAELEAKEESLKKFAEAGAEYAERIKKTRTRKPKA